MIKFLVAHQHIVFRDGPVFQPGTIFKVASDDSGRGCYQATMFNPHTDNENEEVFFDKDDDEFHCIPAGSVIAELEYREALAESEERSF